MLTQLEWEIITSVFLPRFEHRSSGNKRKPVSSHSVADPTGMYHHGTGAIVSSQGADDDIIRYGFDWSRTQLFS